MPPVAKRGKNKRGKTKARPWWRILFRWLALTGCAIVGLILLAPLTYWVINPPTTFYMRAEAKRLGGVEHDWVGLEEVAQVMTRAAVAAEDANFCTHWGFDMDAIRTALEEGARRGASTISQQTVKNVWLWQGRNWWRKVLEAGITPSMELFWTKRRILEVYLNVIEFDTGVFGIEAAARHHFGKSAADLTTREAALLAAVLPDPKGRSAVPPSEGVVARAIRIEDGAETIRLDGRADCFGG